MHEQFILWDGYYQYITNTPLEKNIHYKLQNNLIQAHK